MRAHPAPVWIEEFRVRSYELGPEGALSAESLCDYLQEAAGRHAEELGISIDAIGRDNLTWVLARLDLLLEGLPGRGRTVRVETWPSGAKGFLALREFLVTGDGIPLARATSAWLVIDLERRRPVRLPSSISEIPIPDRERALQRGFRRIPKPGRADHERRFEVRYGDLDVNRHVNHVRYLEWAFETLPAVFLAAHRLVEVEADFRAEVGLGELVEGRAEIEAGGGEQSAIHLLSGASGASEAARLRTRWRPASEPLE